MAVQSPPLLLLCLLHFIFLLLLLPPGSSQTVGGRSLVRGRRRAAAGGGSARDTPIVFQVTEMAKHGVRIGQALSNLAPAWSKQKPTIRYRFSRMNRYLGINDTSGQIWVKSVIDREALCPYVRTCCPTQSDTEQCYIPVKVVRNLNNRPISIVKVRIDVLDINDEPPRFPTSVMRVSLAEDSPIGTPVTVAAADDRDTYQNAVNSYELTYCDDKVFNLTYTRVPGTRKGYEVRLVLIKKLDHETKVTYTCRIQASDGVHKEAMDVQLTVKDVNDHAPQWTRSDFSIRVREDHQRYTQLYQLKAQDKDEDFGEVKYRFGTPSLEQTSPFSLNRDDGQISLERDLNFDDNGQSIYRLPVVAYDNGRPVPLSVTGTLTVTVTDVNDNAPVINVQGTRQDIEENSPPRYLTFITVTDSDQGKNGQTSCELESYNNMFNLTFMDDGAYQLYVTVPIDREQIPTNGILKVGVRCTDAGKTPKTSSEDIMVYIIDVNDHAPKFVKPHYTARLPEDQPGGTVFLTVHATDADYGDNSKLEYSLVADAQLEKYLTVEGHSGVVASGDRFDREEREKYEFQVLVRDRGNPSLNDTTRVTLIISDINDNSPKFPETDRHRFQILESAEIGTLLGVVNASDADAGNNGTVEFSQDHDPIQKPFAVHKDGRIELTRSLDREQVADYSLTVIAKDRGTPLAKVSSTTLIINVLDVNDSPPKFDEDTTTQINISCDEGEDIQLHQAFIRAHDPDEGSTVHYSLGSQQNPWHRFTIDKVTGQLMVKSKPSKCRTTTFTLRVIATDADNDNLFATKNLRVVVRGHTSQRRRPTYPSDEQSGHRYGPPEQPPTESDEMDINLIIIIILVCTAIVLTFVMLAAAFYLRKRQLRSAQEYEKGRREMPDGGTLRRDKDRHMVGPPGPMYSASLPSSPRKDFDQIKKSNMSLEDVYHEHEMDTKASRLKLEGSGSKLKSAQYGNDNDESGVPLNPQVSHDSTHTYQSMSSHKESPENAGYTVFQHELFSYIPDTLRSANVDSKKKNKTSQVTISFV